jgi:hypothetical protein
MLKLSLTLVVFLYSAYKKYVQDEECYDQRSKKKRIKNGTKLKLRHEFPVSISNVVRAIISSMLSTTTVDAKVDLQTQRANTQSNIQSVPVDLTC